MNVVKTWNLQIINFALKYKMLIYRVQDMMYLYISCVSLYLYFLYFLFDQLPVDPLHLVRVTLGHPPVVGQLYCTVLYCTVLYCTVLYCTALYCTVLYLS